jgi:Family of unknown function (DUF5988)
MVELPSEIVHLEGGPYDLPLRVGTVSAGESRLRIEHYGGYEHFERAEPDAAGQPAGQPSGQPSGPGVFRWTGRTHIAE